MESYDDTPIENLTQTEDQRLREEIWTQIHELWSAHHSIVMTRLELIHEQRGRYLEYFDRMDERIAELEASVADLHSTRARDLADGNTRDPEWY